MQKCGIPTSSCVELVDQHSHMAKTEQSQMSVTLTESIWKVKAQKNYYSLSTKVRERQVYSGDYWLPQQRSRKSPAVTTWQSRTGIKELQLK